MKTKKCILATYLSLCTTTVFAGPNLNYHIDGFMTAGFGVLTGTQVDTLQIDAASLATRIGLGEPPLYDTVLVRPNYYGYDGKMDFQLPAIIGVNGSVDFLDNYTAAIQINALGANEFDAQIEWGFLKYKFNDNWAFHWSFKTPSLYAV